MWRVAYCSFFCALLAVTCAVANDTVDWSQLGPAYTLLYTAENWTSTGGTYSGQVGITNSYYLQQNMERLDQGNGWAGNFSPGEALIWNQGGYQNTNIDFGIAFNSLTYGGGAQIQADYFGPFTATLTAYDGFGNVIATVAMNGVSNSNNDGSAIYIGFHSSSQNVSFLNFNVVDAYGGDSMAIGTMTIYDTAAAPEPSTMMLLGSGLLGGLAIAKRRLGV